MSGSVSHVVAVKCQFTNTVKVPCFIVCQRIYGPSVDAEIFGSQSCCGTVPCDISRICHTSNSKIAHGVTRRSTEPLPIIQFDRDEEARGVRARNIHAPAVGIGLRFGGQAEKQEKWQRQ